MIEISLLYLSTASAASTSCLSRFANRSFNVATSALATFRPRSYSVRPMFLNIDQPASIPTANPVLKMIAATMAASTPSRRKHNRAVFPYQYLVHPAVERVDCEPNEQSYRSSRRSLPCVQGPSLEIRWCDSAKRLNV